jgi:NAD(P)-dependent dehydrogenase (short-subunit alcohol dehydrogenase family)
MATWFVTGASRGIGAEIARAALKAGDNVVVAVRNPDRVPDDLKASDTVFPVALDVTGNDSIPTAVQAAVDRFGRIDVLVNNAGRGLLGALEEITDAEARSLFDRTGDLTHRHSASRLRGRPLRVAPLAYVLVADARRWTPVRSSSRRPFPWPSPDDHRR